MVRTEERDGIVTTTDTGDGGRLILVIALGLFIAVAMTWYLIAGLDSLRVAILVVLFVAGLVTAFLLGRNTQRVESVEVAEAKDVAYDQGRQDLAQTQLAAMQITMQTMRMMQQAQAMMTIQPTLPQPQPVPQLSESPRFVTNGQGVYISRDTVLGDATKLLRLHQAGIKVTRRVAQGEGITDPNRYQRAIEQLQAWGYLRVMGQGKTPEWSAAEEDTSPTD